MKVVIVGGEAGGASYAAHLHRLDEKAEIIMVERGPRVPYVNCGLPYHVGGVIEKASSLLLAIQAMFRKMFAIGVRTNCEVIAITRREKPEIFQQALERKPDDIKVVLRFSEA